MRQEELYVRRGNLLWEGSRMMLPEHKQLIIQQLKDDWKVPLHGELDEDQWWEIGEVIMDALNHSTEVNINYWEDGYYKDLVCYIHHVPHDNQSIRVEYGPQDDSIRQTIKARHIYKVERI